MHALVGGRKQHAEAVGEEAVAVAQAGGEVGQGAARGHAQVGHIEVVSGDAVVADVAHALVRRLAHDVAGVEAQEVAVEEKCVVRGAEVGGKQAR